MKVWHFTLNKVPSVYQSSKITELSYHHCAAHFYFYLWKKITILPSNEHDTMPIPIICPLKCPNWLSVANVSLHFRILSLVCLSLVFFGVEPDWNKVHKVEITLYAILNFLSGFFIYFCRILYKLVKYLYIKSNMIEVDPF